MAGFKVFVEQSSFTFELSDFWHQKEQQMMKFLPKNVSVQSNGLAHVYYQDMATEPFCYDLGFFLNDCHIK